MNNKIFYIAEIEKSKVLTKMNVICKNGAAISIARFYLGQFQSEKNKHL